MSFNPRRLFTREEAEALLDEIAALLERGRALVQEQRAARASGSDDGGRRNGHIRPAEAAAEAHGSALAELRAILQQLDEIGVVVRDFESGLVDFPSLLRGRVVFLCWRIGEPPHIAWWHDVDAGFAGRQPLPTDV